jgi:hypothetical protein
MSVILNSPNVVIGHMSGGTININNGTATQEKTSTKQAPQQVEDIEPTEPVTNPPKFFCVSSKFSEQNIRERLAAELSFSNTKIDYCRALYSLQHIGCINISQYASDAKRAEVFNEYQSKFKLSASDFCKARAPK